MEQRENKAGKFVCINNELWSQVEQNSLPSNVINLEMKKYVQECIYLE